MTLKYKKPSAAEYLQIRYDCGFGKVSLMESEKSLNNSLFTVSFYHSKELIGFGRIIGDGILYFYIADVLVHPKKRGAGVGNRIIKELLSYLKNKATKSSTIAVISFRNKESFYIKHGFEMCPNDIFGAGLTYPNFFRETLKSLN